MTNRDEPIAYRPGMTLMPGQSTVVSVPISEGVARQIAGGDFQIVDISAQVFGKYQFCTKAKDAMWYADADFGSGGGCGPLRRWRASMS